MTAQLFARFAGHGRDVGETRFVMSVHEQFRHLFLGFVYGWRDDMRRRFIGQLQDVFTKVGFHDADTGTDQCLVQRNLFRDHRF